MLVFRRSQLTNASRLVLMVKGTALSRNSDSNSSSRPGRESESGALTSTTSWCFFKLWRRPLAYGEKLRPVLRCHLPECSKTWCCYLSPRLPCQVANHPPSRFSHRGWCNIVHLRSSYGKPHQAQEATVGGAPHSMRTQGCLDHLCSPHLRTLTRLGLSNLGPIGDRLPVRTQ